MRRWAIDDYGRVNLRLQTLPGSGEVQIKVAAVALNRRDLMMLADGMGSPLAFPFSPGSDMAGTVEEVGEGATRFQPGERVISTFMPEWIDGRTAGDARKPSYRALGGELPGVMAEYVSLPRVVARTRPRQLGRCRGEHAARCGPHHVVRIG